MHLTLTFLFPEKLILEKLDLQELADTPVRDTSSSSQFSSPGISRFSSSPVVSCIRSREQSGDGSHGDGSHGDRKVTTAGLPRRKRMQTEGPELVCDTLQPDTSSMNASKKLCTSRYFSSPEDCTDADLDLGF